MLEEDDADREEHVNAAKIILNSLIDNYSSKDYRTAEGLLLYCFC